MYPADELALPEDGGGASSNTFQGIGNLGSSLPATPRGEPKRGSFAPSLVDPKTPLGGEPMGDPGAEFLGRLGDQQVVRPLPVDVQVAL